MKENAHSGSEWENGLVNKNISPNFGENERKKTRFSFYHPEYERREQMRIITPVSLAEGLSFIREVFSHAQEPRNLPSFFLNPLPQLENSFGKKIRTIPEEEISSLTMIPQFPFTEIMGEEVKKGNMLIAIPEYNEEYNAIYIAVCSVVSEKRDFPIPQIPITLYELDIAGEKIEPLAAAHAFCDALDGRHRSTLFGLGDIEGTVTIGPNPYIAFGITHGQGHFLLVGEDKDTIPLSPGDRTTHRVQSDLSHAYTWLEGEVHHDNKAILLKTKKRLLYKDDGTFSLDTGFFNLGRQELLDFIYSTERVPYEQQETYEVAIRNRQRYIFLNKDISLDVSPLGLQEGDIVAVSGEKDALFRWVAVKKNGQELNTWQILQKEGKTILNGRWPGAKRKKYHDYCYGIEHIIDGRERLLTLADLEVNTSISSEKTLYLFNNGNIHTRLMLSGDIRSGEVIHEIPYLSEENRLGLAIITAPKNDSSEMKISFAAFHQDTHQFSQDKNLTEATAILVMGKYLDFIKEKYNLTEAQYHNLWQEIDSKIEKQKISDGRKLYATFFNNPKDYDVAKLPPLFLTSSKGLWIFSYEGIMVHVSLRTVPEHIPLCIIPYIGEKKGVAIYPIPQEDISMKPFFASYDIERCVFRIEKNLTNEIIETTFTLFQEALARKNIPLTTSSSHDVRVHFGKIKTNKTVPQLRFPDDSVSFSYGYKNRIVGVPTDELEKSHNIFFSDTSTHPSRREIMLNDIEGNYPEIIVLLRGGLVEENNKKITVIPSTSTLYNSPEVVQMRKPLEELHLPIVVFSTNNTKYFLLQNDLLARYTEKPIWQNNFFVVLSILFQDKKISSKEWKYIKKNLAQDAVSLAIIEKAMIDLASTIESPKTTTKADTQKYITSYASNLARVLWVEYREALLTLSPEALLKKIQNAFPSPPNVRKIEGIDAPISIEVIWDVVAKQIEKKGKRGFSSFNEEDEE